MRIPKYLLAVVAIGGLLLLPQPTSASPLTAGLINGDTAASEFTSELVQNVHKKKRHYRKHYSKYQHRRHRRHYSKYQHRRHREHYPYYSSFYCDDYYGDYYGCGYPRRYPGFFFAFPNFSIGFGY
jgi:hypothetical protein